MIYLLVFFAAAAAAAALRERGEKEVGREEGGST
jgi:hypothetical protein